MCAALFKACYPGKPKSTLLWVALLSLGTNERGSNRTQLPRFYNDSEKKKMCGSAAVILECFGFFSIHMERELIALAAMRHEAKTEVSFVWSTLPPTPQPTGGGGGWEGGQSACKDGSRFNAGHKKKHLTWYGN